MKEVVCVCLFRSMGGRVVRAYIFKLQQRRFALGRKLLSNWSPFEYSIVAERRSAGAQLSHDRQWMPEAVVTPLPRSPPVPARR